MFRKPLSNKDSGTLMMEKTDVVEESPAPLHPRPDSAAVSREPAGGSPCRDEIDDLVDASLERGPQRNQWLKCPYCDREWHGFQNERLCQGSHYGRSKKRNA